MSQAPAQIPPRTPPEDDPIAHLHKMSTTAGLGSGDYVAVNPVAVAAALAGLASTLALADNVLLLIPIVGIVLSIIALIQISHSNGTQTGRGLAWIGLVLSFGFVAAIGGRTVQQDLRTRADRNQIDELITSLGTAVHDGNFDQAYLMFNARFADRVKKAEFIAQMRYVQKSPIYGELRGAARPGPAQFETDQVSGERVAAAQIQFNFINGSEVREDAIFRKTDDHWLIENLPQIFLTRQQLQQQQQQPQ